ncbi:hypothetical protein HYW19_03100 [Candidatus Woesearchaeota archaeon]|nr:hypothetical protein [Candidatus Woesearchaeota archaeon]
MNIDELASLMGKTRKHLEEELKKTEVIELNLAESGRIEEADRFSINFVDK